MLINIQSKAMEIHHIMNQMIYMYIYWQIICRIDLALPCVCIYIYIFFECLIRYIEIIVIRTQKTSNNYLRDKNYKHLRDNKSYKMIN
jgi:hypothetical protein